MGSGSGSTVVYAMETCGNTTYFTTACQNYGTPGGGTPPINAQVTIAAPASGNIVVWATAYINITHTSGTEKELLLAIGSSATDCGTIYDETIWTDPAAEPTWATTNGYPSGAIIRTFQVMRSFAVSAAGSYTYYLNGEETQGNVATTDNFYFSTMYAMYVP